MAILPYDVNTYLSTHSAMINVLNNLSVPTPIAFIPLNQPEPCNASGTPLGYPFIRYYWLPNIFSMHRWFIRNDRIRYYIMDRDINRSWQISNVLLKILAQTDTRSNPHQIPCGDGQNRIFYSTITQANLSARTVSQANFVEKGGLSESMLEFEFRYVDALL